MHMSEVDLSPELNADFYYYRYCREKHVNFFKAIRACALKFVLYKAFKVESIFSFVRAST